MPNILLVDDFPVVRQGLRQILSSSIPDVEIAEAGSAEDAAVAVDAGDWDLLVLDISLPGKSGFDLLKEMQQRHSRLPVLMLSRHREDQFAVRALRAGASGYLNKKAVVAELVTAVRKVLAGRRYVSETLAERLAGDVGLAPGLAPHELLSPREFEVFRLLAEGMRVNRIAAKLEISVPTVSTHRAHILEKMGLAEVADLISYAQVNAILD